MAIQFLQKEKKQKYLILVLIILVLAIGLVIFYGFGVKRKEPLVSKQLSLPAKPVKEVKINFDLLESPFFQEFEPFEKIKLYSATTATPTGEEVEMGRKNPFVPYWK